MIRKWIIPLSLLLAPLQLGCHLVFPFTAATGGQPEVSDRGRDLAMDRRLTPGDHRWLDGVSPELPPPPDMLPPHDNTYPPDGPHPAPEVSAPLADGPACPSKQILLQTSFAPTDGWQYPDAPRLQYNVAAAAAEWPTAGQGGSAYLSTIIPACPLQVALQGSSPTGSIEVRFYKSACSDAPSCSTAQLGFSCTLPPGALSLLCQPPPSNQAIRTIRLFRADGQGSTASAWQLAVTVQ